MSEQGQGIDRHGLDASFQAEETLKSNLIVEAQLLSAQEQADAAEVPAEPETVDPSEEFRRIIDDAMRLRAEAEAE